MSAMRSAHSALTAKHRWAEGAYAAVPSPGTWLAHAESGWRRPVGSLHWAGTETASVWNGYIDGAIRSGLRAAHDVVGELAGRAGE
ncbi:FAD-dependent oxidoreductase [Streptomyces sp. NPDC091412]|uniref:FAD-dependent oxidoreductase n=1 Tax=Streptomyces sp. NPDC091412 TaxID=3366002 RepID=UPI00382DABFA